jgi:hypothetical protein
LKEFVVNWFRPDAFSFHMGDRLALAMVILVSFALTIALSKLVFWLFAGRREAEEREGEAEKEYWHIHGE